MTKATVGRPLRSNRGASVAGAADDPEQRSEPSRAELARAINEGELRAEIDRASGFDPELAV